MEATSARSGTSVKIRQTILEAFIPCNNNIFPSPVSLCWSGSCPEAMMHSSTCLLASPSAPRPQQQHSCLRLLALCPGSSLQGAWALGYSSSTHVLIRQRQIHSRKIAVNNVYSSMSTRRRRSQGGGGGGASRDCNEESKHLIPGKHWPCKVCSCVHT